MPKKKKVILDNKTLDRLLEENFKRMKRKARKWYSKDLICEKCLKELINA